MANRVILEMADAFNWPKLIKTGVFNLASGEETYELPDDFSYYHHDTFWNITNSWPLYGPLTPQEYGERYGYNLDGAIYDEFTLRGITDNYITITPTPTASGSVIAFQYTSRRPVRPRTWAEGQSVAAGDYTFFDGVYYTATNAGTTGTGADPTADTGGIGWVFYNGPYESFLADTDEPVLSQRILEQGVLERFAVIKQLNVLQLYDDQLQAEFAKQVPGKVLHAADTYRHRFQYARNGRVNFGG